MLRGAKHLPVREKQAVMSLHDTPKDENEPLNILLKTEGLAHIFGADSSASLSVRMPAA